MNLDALVKSIESLPPLSDTAVIVQQLYADGAENVNVLKLVRAIESDALFSANILRMINAPIYGFSKRIASVSQAVTLFGVKMIYGIVLNYAIHEKIKANLSPYGITNASFNEMCHLQSQLMMQWYSKVNLRHAQFLSPLALIMESGKLVIAQEVMRSGKQKEFQEGLRKASSVEMYEHQIFGTTSYYVTGMLFDYWNLEPLYVEMLKSLDFEPTTKNEQMEEYVASLDTIRIAVNVRDILSDSSIANAKMCVQELGFDELAFEDTAKRLQTKHLGKI